MDPIVGGREDAHHKKGDWSDIVRKNGSWLGKLNNPGKRFFLEIAATAVRAVNGMRDSCGLTYARKSMIRCGMALDVSGRWHESQFTPELQQILANIASTTIALPFSLLVKPLYVVLMTTWQGRHCMIVSNDGIDSSFS